MATHNGSCTSCVCEGKVRSSEQARKVGVTMRCIGEGGGEQQGTEVD